MDITAEALWGWSRNKTVVSGAVRHILLCGSFLRAPQTWGLPPRPREGGRKEYPWRKGKRVVAVAGRVKIVCSAPGIVPFSKEDFA